MSELDLEVQPDDLGNAESAQDDQDDSDDPDVEPEPEDDPGEPGEAPQAETAQGMTPEALDKLRKKIETSSNTWRRRLEELLGEDFGLLTPCELCGDEFPGYHWPADVMQPANDLQAHLLDVLRLPLAPDLMQAPDTRICTACGGEGKALTGSKVPDKKTKTCTACKGFGYVPPPDSARPQVVNTETGEITDAPEPFTTPEADADVWGSPRILDDGRENPNYGKMPQYKDANLP